MIKHYLLFLIFFYVSSAFAQKDSLQLGDNYADDQLYISISYAQFSSQPSNITKSNFSYALSTGFMKDFILNKKGSFSFALGIGYGFQNFNHELKVDQVNGQTLFDDADNVTANLFKSHNLEIPLELRWRTSNANKYDFWRIYTGIKFLYNLSNSFQYLDANQNSIQYNNITSYRNLQYGLTLSAGYDAFNVNVFYGLSPIFENATINNNESIATSILKFGFIFYIL